MKNKLKNRSALLLILGVVFVFSCNNGANAGSGTGAVAKAEAIMQEEMRLPPPDFRYPYIEVKDMVVPGMPEQVTWITAEGKNLGSKDAKVGGVIRRNTSEFPVTYRYVGPEANGAMRGAFWQNAPCVSYVRETQTFLPYAATHWAYDADMRGVYFKLNENVRWSDGVPCKASDYLYYWEQMINPNLNDPWYNNYYSQFKLEVLGDYLIYVRITDPNYQVSAEALLDSCAWPARPEHFYGGPLKENWYEEYNWKAEPTTGPYVFDEENTVQGEIVAFKRVENWWAREYPQYEGLCNIERIEYRVITGGADMIENYFYDQQLDTFTVAIPDTIRRSETKEPVQKGYIDRYYLNIIPLEGLSSHIFFNLGDPLFSDKRVRQAMYYAIDVQGMIDQALYGEYSRYHNIGLGQEFAGVNFNDNTIRKPDFNPDKAKELLAEAGYTTLGSDGILRNASGARVSFELMYASRNHTDRLTILVEQAKKAGVEINLRLMESGAFQLMRKKQYQAQFSGFSTGVIPSPWQMWHSDNHSRNVAESNNVTDFDNPEMDKLIEAFEAAGTLQEQAEINKQIERLVHEEAPVIPLYYVGYTFVAAWKWVRFPAWGAEDKEAYYFNDPFWSYMWVDEDIRTEVLDAMSKGETFTPRYYRLTERYKQN